MNKANLMGYRKQLFACLLAFELIPAIRNKAEIKKNQKFKKSLALLQLLMRK